MNKSQRNCFHSLNRKGTLYDALAVSPISSKQEIKAQFYRLSLLYHPDRPPIPNNCKEDTTAWRKEKFIQISHAYSILSNDLDRKAYDLKHGIINVKRDPRSYRPFLDHYHRPPFRNKPTTDQGGRIHPQEFIVSEIIKRRSRWKGGMFGAEEARKIKEARLASEQEQRMEASSKRNRFIILMAVVICYIISSSHNPNH